MKIGDKVYVVDPDESDPEQKYEGEILDIVVDYGEPTFFVGFETEYYYKVRSFTREEVHNEKNTNLDTGLLRSLADIHYHLHQ